jgi:protein O-GlcNAc transferase
MVARGIAPHRVVVSATSPLGDHLALKRLGDLHLDSFPYNGHTTALDALWAGVPHLTLAGGSGPSRVGASVLAALGRGIGGVGAGGGWVSV